MDRPDTRISKRPLRVVSRHHTAKLAGIIPIDYLHIFNSGNINNNKLPVLPD